MMLLFFGRAVSEARTNASRSRLLPGTLPGPRCLRREMRGLGLQD